MRLTAGDVANLKAQMVWGYFDTMATVYGADPTTHNYTAVLKSGLKCFLRHLSSQQDAGARDELSGRREMWFEGNYVMPENVELLIDGTRWTPLVGTQTSMLGGSYRRVDIIEARS